MTTYYVAPDGSDGNSGTESSPWYSLGEAAGTVSPGDTVVVRDGVYNYSSTQKLNGPDGTSQDPIRVRAANGATPVFSFDGPEGGGWSADDDGGIRIGAAHWVIEGIEVKDSPWYGIVFASSGNYGTARNCTAHNNHLVGIAGFEATNLTIENCTSYDNYGSTSDGGDSDGIQLSHGHDSVVRNCTAYANSDDGYDFWGATGVLVDRCMAYDNGRGGGDGNGFKMGGGDSSGNNTVQRSAAWRNRSLGFDYNAASEPVYFYNNTSWDNSQGYFAENGCVLKNNISYEDGKVLSTWNTTEEANTWDLGIDNPRFRSTDPTSEEFLRLSENSPAIDAGADVGLSYEGDAPDLGCHEFGASEDESSQPTLYYHDGSGWREVAVKYHDGSGFV